MPDNSRFRLWFRNCLRFQSGNVVEWPILIRSIFAEELQLLRNSGEYYKGSVFRNRDDRVQVHRDRTSNDEEVLVYRLYGKVHDEAKGVLKIGDEDIWLFSCEVPNQGRSDSNLTKKRRADLVGLRRDGSLVVFECKGPLNSKDNPLYALLEGLDYLGCLLNQRNLTKLSDGLQEWIQDSEFVDTDSNTFRSGIPAWPSIGIKRDAPHSVIVLAPQEYYEHHRKDPTLDWWMLSDDRQPCSDSDISLRFAVTDFGSGTASWFESTVSKPTSATPNASVPETTPAANAQNRQLPRDLIWVNEDGQRIRVKRVKCYRLNSRVRYPDAPIGESFVVPTERLEAANPE